MTETFVISQLPLDLKKAVNITYRHHRNHFIQILCMYALWYVVDMVLSAPNRTCGDAPPSEHPIWEEAMRDRGRVMPRQI